MTVHEIAIANSEVTRFRSGRFSRVRHKLLGIHRGLLAPGCDPSGRRRVVQRKMQIAVETQLPVSLLPRVEQFRHDEPATKHRALPVVARVFVHLLLFV